MARSKRTTLIPNTFNRLVVIAVALGSTACSYGMSVISSTIGQPSFYTDLGMAQQGTPGYEHTSQLIGAFNGVNSAGSALAAALTAWTANRIGRLRSIELGAVVTIVGGALCAGSVNIGMYVHHHHLCHSSLSSCFDHPGFFLRGSLRDGGLER